MGVDVTTEVVIRRPAAVVAGYAANPDNAADWYANIASASWNTPPPLAVGSLIVFAARFLGRTLTYTYEIVELVPGERLVMRTAQGPFPMQTTYTWSAVGPDSTRMTLRNNGQPAGFSRLLAPFMGRAVRRANEKDLARLKSRLETDTG
jgi:uncharacterized membrane protein